MLNETKAPPKYEYVKDFAKFVSSEFFFVYEGKEFIPYPFCICLMRL